MVDPAKTWSSSSATTIRAVTMADPAALKAVIDATGLFPSDLLEGMLASFLDGTDKEAIWLTAALAGNDQPFAVAYCAPERMTSGTWNLYLIAVHPDCQGHGHGSALLAQIEAMLGARGERVLLVETSGLPAFSRTRAFYEGCGYDEEARIREFYQVGEDKIVFRKALSRSQAEPNSSDPVATNQGPSP